jgi:hypothetical protein
MSTLVASLVLALFVAETPRPNADVASEGERNLEKLVASRKKFFTGQPYGKTWVELSKTEPAPKDRTGLGEAQTHDHLSKDPMEIQQQVVFLEPTRWEARYGTLVIRGVRVFRYGKLMGVRLVHEPAGRPDPAKFLEDVEAYAAAWKTPEGFKMLNNDFIVQKKLKPEIYPKPPLVIELEPQK